MNKPNRSVYTPLDFAEWKTSNTLSLTPKFQRRGVWKPAARSFFIDTLLRGMPVPPIYIRQTQNADKTKMIREVIDGQQRVSAVLAFLEGEYRLSKTLKTWGGSTFENLTVDQQDAIKSYSFSAEVFYGISDLEVLEIFSRLNTYSVPLNAQELRNGKYFGRFKQSCYALAYEHLEFWRRHKIFAEQSIARMLEVEFVSEVVIAFLAGMQDKKGSIDSFYINYDENYPLREQMEKRFREVVDDITESFGDALKETEFGRTPLLYTLFCVVYHRRYGLPGVTIQTPKKPLTKSDRVALREAAEQLSESIDTAKAKADVQKAALAFVTASLRQTDNIAPRKTRFKDLYSRAFG